MNLPKKEDKKKMGFDAHNKMTHNTERSVKAWVESGKHLPRHDNWTSSTLLPCNYVMLPKELPSWL